MSLRRQIGFWGFARRFSEGQWPREKPRAIPAGICAGRWLRHQEKHHAALTTKDGARAVMRALDAYQGSFVVCAAVRFTALTFVRQVELRFATWDEIDWEERMWLIPAERMKMRREHMVPLSRQAIAVLEEMRRVNGTQPYIFTGQGRRRRPISENTVRCALQSMGFAGEMTAHGFRSMASTLAQRNGLALGCYRTPARTR